MRGQGVEVSKTLFLRGGFVVKRCVGVWWLSGRRQGTCRPLTDATLWRTGGLQIFWEDFGAGPLNAAGGLCKELTFLRLWQGISNS